MCKRLPISNSLIHPSVCLHVFLFPSFLANENEFDAIVFFSHKLNRWSNVPDQNNRKSGQRYIMFTQESPLLDSIDRTHFNGFFNWTMTYRCQFRQRFMHQLLACRSQKRQKILSLKDLHS